MEQIFRRTQRAVGQTSLRCSGLVCTMALALFLVGCASSPLSISRPTPTPSPSAVPSATPTLVAPPLADPPTNCKGLPQPQNRWPFALGPVVGSGPLWATLPPVFHISPSVSPNGTTNYTSYGWIWKVVWEVGPNYPNSIALQATRVGDQNPLWFEFDGPPTTTPVLDPAHPSHPD